jgi:hypothetical protein
VLEKGVSDGTEFVVDALRYFEPVQRVEMWSDMMVFWNETDDACQAVLDVLEAG